MGFNKRRGWLVAVAVLVGTLTASLPTARAVPPGHPFVPHCLWRDPDTGLPRCRLGQRIECKVLLKLLKFDLRGWDLDGDPIIDDETPPDLRWRIDTRSLSTVPNFFTEFTGTDKNFLSDAITGGKIAEGPRDRHFSFERDGSYRKHVTLSASTSTEFDGNGANDTGTVSFLSEPADQQIECVPGVDRAELHSLRLSAQNVDPNGQWQAGIDWIWNIDGRNAR